MTSLPYKWKGLPPGNVGEDFFGSRYSGLSLLAGLLLTGGSVQLRTGTGHHPIIRVVLQHLFDVGPAYERHAVADARGSQPALCHELVNVLA